MHGSVQSFEKIQYYSSYICLIFCLVMSTNKPHFLYEEFETFVDNSLHTSKGLLVLSSIHSPNDIFSLFYSYI